MKNKLKRRAALIAAVVLLLSTVAVAFTACAGGGKSKDSDLIDFKLGYLPSTGHLLYFVAKEEGFFEEEGLNVELSNFDGNSNIVMAVEAGKLDAAAIGAGTSISYIQQGAQCTIIGGMMTEGAALVVKPELVEGIDPADYSLELFKGKHLAGSKNGWVDTIYRKAFQDMGWEVGVDVFIDYSDTADLSSLLNASVDGVVVYTPFRALAEKQGYVVLVQNGEITPFQNYPCCRNLTSTALLKEHPERYVAFQRALIKAYKFYQENHEETVADIAKYCDTDIDLIRNETYGEHISSIPDPDTKAIWVWYDDMLYMGYIDEFDLESAIDPTTYKQALDQLAAENPEEQIYQDLLKHYDEFNVNYTREDYFDLYDDEWNYIGRN